MIKLTPMQQYSKVQALIAAERQARTLGTGRMLSDATFKRIRAAAARFELQHGPSYVLRSFSSLQLSSAQGFPDSMAMGSGKRSDYLATVAAAAFATPGGFDMTASLMVLSEGVPLVTDSVPCAGHATPAKAKATTDDKLTWAFITTLGLLAGMALYASAQIAGVL